MTKKPGRTAGELAMEKEVDHRVKNSLQLVISMLRLQINATESSETRDALGTAVGRVQAVANLHEQLHSSRNSDSVDLVAFLQRICDSLQDMFPEDVTFSYDFKPVEIDTERAHAVGVIVNEFVTNSAKYAFRDGSADKLSVFTDSDDTYVTIVLRDNGPGFPEGFAPEHSTGLGLRIIKASAMRLDAAPVWEDADPGTQLTLKVRRLHPGRNTPPNS